MEGWLSCDMPILCPLCNKELVIDDVDFRFKGNKDVYCYCEHCFHLFILYFRYGSLVRYVYEEIYFDNEYKTYIAKGEQKIVFVKGDK